jgi:hypothetical protein
MFARLGPSLVSVEWYLLVWDQVWLAHSLYTQELFHLWAPNYSHAENKQCVQLCDWRDKTGCSLRWTNCGLTFVKGVFFIFFFSEAYAAVCFCALWSRTSSKEKFKIVRYMYFIKRLEKTNHVPYVSAARYRRFTSRKSQTQVTGFSQVERCYMRVWHSFMTFTNSEFARASSIEPETTWEPTGTLEIHLKSS